jgi:ATP-dependent exoDNAse (exonuclease V) beta subunit
MKKVQSAMITAWSYSRWNTYSQCPLKAKLEYIDKITSPPSDAMKNGLRVHKLAEDFVIGKIQTLPKELSKHAEFFRAMRKLYAAGDPGLMVEGELAFRKDWSPCGWFDKDCWLRVKCDIVYEFDGDIHIGDVKTGSYKTFQKGAYLTQLSLYSLALLLKYPERRVIPRLMYVDHGFDFPDTFEIVYTASDLPRLKKEWLKRVSPMLKDKKFLPTPNRLCGWCAYHKHKGGQCDA